MQMETDRFYIQSQQPETPSSDERPSLFSEPPPNAESLFLGDLPDEEMIISLADGSDLEPDLMADSFAAGLENAPISGLDLPAILSSEALDDADLLAFLLEENDDQDPLL